MKGQLRETWTEAPGLSDRTGKWGVGRQVGEDPSEISEQSASRTWGRKEERLAQSLQRGAFWGHKKNGMREPVVELFDSPRLLPRRDYSVTLISS